MVVLCFFEEKQWSPSVSLGFSGSKCLDHILVLLQDWGNITFADI